MSVEIAIYFSISNFQYFSFEKCSLFFKFIYNIKRKVIQIINTNDFIVKASGKKYMTSQGFEPGIPAQVPSTETTIPLRMA
jgi:hypothetical protein